MSFDVLFREGGGRMKARAVSTDPSIGVLSWSPSPGGAKRGSKCRSLQRV